MEIYIGSIGFLVIVVSLTLFGLKFKNNRNIDKQLDKGYISKEEWREKHKSFISNIVGCISGITLIIFAFSFVIIPTGYTGVKTTFGQIDQNTLQNGFNLKIPFVQNIEKVNNKQQDIVFKDNTISSETCERNTVVFKGITVTYTINPEKSAWIFANVADYEDNLVSEALVASAIKTSSKTLTPTDVTNRSILEPKAQENIQSSLDEKYGKNIITINKVVIDNASFDKAYDKKIAKKQQIENKKNIEKAEADATVKKTNAHAEAEAKKIAAEAESEANKKVAASITDKLIENKLAEARDKHGWVTVQGANSVVTK